MHANSYLFLNISLKSYVIYSPVRKDPSKHILYWSLYLNVLCINLPFVYDYFYYIIGKILNICRYLKVMRTHSGEVQAINIFYHQSHNWIISERRVSNLGIPVSPFRVPFVQLYVNKTHHRLWSILTLITHTLMCSKNDPRIFIVSENRFFTLKIFAVVLKDAYNTSLYFKKTFDSKKGLKWSWRKSELECFLSFAIS